MTLEGWTQSLTAGPLLLIAAAAIAVLLFLIIQLRVHAFVALILVSLATAFATGIPTSQIVPVLVGGFGTTLGTVALLVGLGAMLGRLVETSGGAQALGWYRLQTAPGCGYAVDWFDRSARWTDDHLGTAKIGEGLALALQRIGDDPRAADLSAAWASADRDGIVDAVLGERGLLAGTWCPDHADRAALADTLTAFDKR